MKSPDEKQHDRILTLAAVILGLACWSVWQQFFGLADTESLFRLEPGSSLYTLCAVVLISLVTASIILRNSSVEVKNSAELALVDRLTGLANAAMFDKRLAEEICRNARHDKNLAVLYLDLDRFMEINDCYGRDVGDRVIREIGSRLQSVLRSEDMLARLDADEFAAVVTEVGGADDIERITERMLRRVREPFNLDSVKIYANVSIGAAIITPGEVDASEAMRRADMALLQAKSEGRGRLKIFDPGMEVRIRNRREMETRLREAIAAKALSVEYQPTISEDSREVTGVEALARWNDPEQGSISPGEFIPLAEDTGLIHELGELVLEQACTDMKKVPDLKLAVNISPMQFGHAEFVEAVKRILGETEFEPGRLELEITESTFISNPAKAAETINEIRQLGVRMALDDFGTGYSSMSYLNQFALDRIKIDRSFVRNVTNSHQALQLVSTMIHLGNALGLSVTVEGIETDSQLAKIREHGRAELQGFLFSKPVPFDKLKEALSSWPARAAA